MAASKRIVIAITGATGAIYGVRLLHELSMLPDWESHLVISEAGLVSLAQETGLSQKEVARLAAVCHSPRNIAASIASGSFLTEGMIVAPTSMKTLAAIAQGYGDNLVSRAADVVLKERRRLVLVARETPLNLAHLRNMVAVTEMGAIVFPPVPAFYAGILTLDDMVGHTVGRILDLFGIHSAELTRWEGARKPAGRGKRRP